VYNKETNVLYLIKRNIQSLNRNKNTESGSNKMDELTYAYKTNKPNQLKRVDDAVTTATNADDIKDQTTENNYIYNSIGQLIENKDEQVKYAYNASGLVTEVQKNGTPRVRFFYDDRGHRIRKEVYDALGNTFKTYYVRDASGSPMGIYSGAFGPTILQPTVLKEQPIYGSSRLGVHYRQSGTDAYQLTDHLGNVRAVIMKNGENAVSLTAKTDYYPFGMPMPNRNLEGNYRYKYQGQEKDPETGKEAFELRLWDSRIGRWLTPDPYGEFSSPYVGMGNNPITTIDIDGGKIYVTNKAGISYEYKNGSLYDKNGNIYSGDDKFLNATRAALGKLDYATSSYAINDGKIEKTGTIHRLVKSDDIYAIVYKRGAHKTGGRIYIDNKATVSTPTAAGIKKSPYEITLAHELGHLYSKNNGFYNGNEWFNIEGQSRTFDENFASHWENIFRSALDLPLRTHYGVFDGKPYEPSKLFWPRGAFFHKPVSTIAPKPIITLEVGPLIQGEIEH